MTHLKRPALAVILAALCLPPPSTVSSVETKATSEQLALFEGLQAVIVEVSGRVKPWVVHVEAVQKKRGRKFKVLGSGLILDDAGYIVTNHHIVDETTLITVTLSEGTKLEATLIGSDQQTDLALIKIDAAGLSLPTPTLGDSDMAKVGQWIIAVGNPYGFDRTVYFGIVSGKGRTLSSLDPYNDIDSGFSFTTDFIQTDASIDPGSSGGPLVNLKGEVIGINSMGLGRGISFTVPINTAKKVIKQLLSGGKLARGWIGLSIQPLTRNLARHFKIKGDGGVLVSEVAKNSPAARAGFQQGDIIIELNSRKVHAIDKEELNRFSQTIWNSDVGDRLPVRAIRNGKHVTLAVIVAKQPRMKAREFETSWGLNVKEITENIYRNFLLEDRNGVIVSFVEAGTAAGEARLLEGDVIKLMAGTPTLTLADFKKQYAKLKSQAEPVLLLVKRRKDHIFVLLELEKYKAESKP